MGALEGATQGLLRSTNLQLLSQAAEAGAGSGACVLPKGISNGEAFGVTWGACGEPVGWDKGINVFSVCCKYLSVEKQKVLTIP